MSKIALATSHRVDHGLRFQDLRHTAASLLIAAGVYPKAIQEHLEHRDITTTLNVYGRLLPSAREALAASLDATYMAVEQPRKSDAIELRDE